VTLADDRSSSPARAGRDRRRAAFDLDLADDHFGAGGRVADPTTPDRGSTPADRQWASSVDRLVACGRRS